MYDEGYLVKFVSSLDVKRGGKCKNQNKSKTTTVSCMINLGSKFDHNHMGIFSKRYGYMWLMEQGNVNRMKRLGLLVSSRFLGFFVVLEKDCATFVSS